MKEIIDELMLRGEKEGEWKQTKMNEEGERGAGRKRGREGEREAGRKERR